MDAGVQRAGKSVLAVERDADGAVSGVRTTAGRLAAEVVINVAGPRATEVGRLAGVDLAIAPRRRQAFGIAPLPWLTPSLPLTIDLGSGAYVHAGISGKRWQRMSAGAVPGTSERAGAQPPISAASVLTVRQLRPVLVVASVASK